MLRFGKVTHRLSIQFKECICPFKVYMVPAYMCTMLSTNSV